MLDQHTATADGGIWVNFGGLPATVSNGVALLSRRFQAPVYLVFPHGRCDGTYDFRILPVLRPEPGEEDAAFTQRIVDGLVRHIRRYPSQWMLMYPRWSRIPPGMPADGFPYYAVSLPGLPLAEE